MYIVLGFFAVITISFIFGLWVGLRNAPQDHRELAEQPKPPKPAPYTPGNDFEAVKSVVAGGQWDGDPLKDKPDDYQHVKSVIGCTDIYNSDMLEDDSVLFLTPERETEIFNKLTKP